jgi:hypothetical protein
MAAAMHVIEDAQLHNAQQEWFRGGSALPLVSLYVSRGEVVEAGVVARAALEQADCTDAGEIEKLLDQLDEAPDDFLQSLKEFAAAPSIERWRDIMRFVPPELSYQRQRNSIRRLRRMGLDGNMLFLCACEVGMTPDAIGLVEEGLVDADVIVDRASRAGDARATYLGLAATAAYVHGDVVGAIRLLRECMANENEWCLAFPHIEFIRDHASAEINAALDQAGIP